jgi:hypothetical protein
MRELGAVLDAEVRWRRSERDGEAGRRCCVGVEAARRLGAEPGRECPMRCWVGGGEW